MTSEETIRAAGTADVSSPSLQVGSIQSSVRAGRLARLARARESRRVLAFLVAGGISALVTLSVTAACVDLAHQPFALGAALGTELGIVVNFAVNDRLTFVDLPGHRRRLLVRALRFHLTCAIGQSVIFVLSLLLHDVAHWRTLMAQALPIGVVTALNFTLHRLWTYRGLRRVPAAAPAGGQDAGSAQ